jgi:PTS system mannose-specific IIB component/fructoselysine and glucoselysine-specific PTS system IIB component
MAIIVARIDDRLVHGQVVIGWGRPLNIARIVLVDDGVAASEFEQDLYRMAAPTELEVEFLTAAAAPARVSELGNSPERVLVLTGTVAGMTGLARASDAIQVINLGGVHDGPGRREYLRFLYLTDDERADLAALALEGVAITAQDLPSSAPVELEALR